MTWCSSLPPRFAHLASPTSPHHTSGCLPNMTGVSALNNTGDANAVLRPCIHVVSVGAHLSLKLRHDLHSFHLLERSGDTQ